jgi:hypothetical protein
LLHGHGIKWGKVREISCLLHGLAGELRVAEERSESRRQILIVCGSPDGLIERSESAARQADRARNAGEDIADVAEGLNSPGKAIKALLAALRGCINLDASRDIVAGKFMRRTVEGLSMLNANRDCNGAGNVWTAWTSYDSRYTQLYACLQKTFGVTIAPLDYGIFRWPFAALLFGIVFLVLFRSRISEFISRVRSVGKDGVSTQAPAERSIEQQADAPTSKDIQSLLQTFDSPALLNQEKMIFADLKARGLDTDSDTTKVLVRHLARTQLNLGCEFVYRLIFGSQIALLKRVNSAPGGLTDNEAKQFYELITERHREIFPVDDSGPFFEFLIRQGLILRDGGRFHISGFGKEFLAWLVQSGVSEYKAI